MGYATWNPSDKHSDITLSNGNLTVGHTGSTYRSVRSTVSVSSGKWYWEITVDSSRDQVFGVGNSSASLSEAPGWSDTSGWGLQGYYSPTRLYHNGSYDGYGSQWSDNDVIGVALDLDNGKLWFSKNGVYPNGGDPANGTNPGATGVSGHIYAMVSPYNSSCSSTTNFGSTPFSYTVPNGFMAGLTDYLGYFSGYVKEGDVAVSRIVRLYNRNSGLLVDSTTSSGNGYYYVETTYSGAHYLIALDDDSGDSYNMARLDKMIPVSII